VNTADSPPVRRPNGCHETISRLGLPRDRPFLVILQIGQTDIVIANNKTKSFGSATFRGAIMGGPVRSDNGNAEFRDYVPRRYREQVAPELERQPYVTSASTVPSAAELDRIRRTRSDHVLWPDVIPEPPESQGDRFLALLGRVGLVSALAAVVALLLVFRKPILEPVLETVRPLINADSQSKPIPKVAERVAAPDSGANKALAVALPAATSTGPQVRLAPPTQQQSSLSPSATPLGTPVRGVTDSEIQFGVSAPLTGPAKELGQNIKLGIEAAFNVANANGGSTAVSSDWSQSTMAMNRRAPPRQ
jgi:hypothetical protein